MDPNATLRLIAEALEELESLELGNFDAREEIQKELAFTCNDLAGWIAKGGFQPDWLAHPKGAGYYLTWTVRP